MNTKVENNILFLLLEGRIDSGNAAAVEEEINAALAANPHDDVVADAEKLEYISSAGLRVILRLRKAEAGLKITNVNSDVYEIFSMTGFTEMMPIEKAYRRLSVEGCEVIGQGANGVVYRTDPDTIVKVYRDANALPDIHKERELARKAFVMGIPTAIPYDVVKVGDTYGSVFELLNAKSFCKLIIAEPEKVDYYMGLTVDVLKKMHSTEVAEDELPDMRETAIRWVNDLKEYLPEDKQQKLMALITGIPKDNHMMHGDYHVKNVMMQNGEVLLIDMDTLCRGNPIFEFGFIYNAYCGFGDFNHDNIFEFMGIDYDTTYRMWRKTLEDYFGADDRAKLDEIEKKAKLVGYTRIFRRMYRRGLDKAPDGADKALYYKENLIRLIDEVDTLLI